MIEKPLDGWEDMADVTLVELSLNGNKEAFSKLVLKYQTPLFGFVLSRVKEENTAQDIVQDTFFKSYKSLNTCTKPEGFSKWIFTVASNLCRDWHKNKRRLEKPITHEIEQKETGSDRASLLRNVESVIDTLSDDIQLVLSLKHEQDMSCTEIARFLGKPVGTITSILARAHKTIREKLEVQNEL